MTTSKYADMKYVVLIGVGIFITLLCSAIIDTSFIDVLYLVLIFICAIRYIIVCLKGYTKKEVILCI